MVALLTFHSLIVRKASFVTGKREKIRSFYSGNLFRMKRWLNGEERLILKGENHFSNANFESGRTMILWPWQSSRIKLGSKSRLIKVHVVDIKARLPLSEGRIWRRNSRPVMKRPLLQLCRQQEKGLKYFARFSDYGLTRKVKFPVARTR